MTDYTRLHFGWLVDNPRIGYVAVEWLQTWRSRLRSYASYRQTRIGRLTSHADRRLDAFTWTIIVIRRRRSTHGRWRCCFRVVAVRGSSRCIRRRRKGDIFGCATSPGAVHLAGPDAAVRRQAVRALAALAAEVRELFRFAGVHARLVVAHVVRVLEELSALITLRCLLFCNNEIQVNVSVNSRFI